MKYQIIDNFLDHVTFHKIQKDMVANLDWYYSDSVAFSHDNKDYYFTHNFMDQEILQQPTSKWYPNIMSPILDRLDKLNMPVRSLIRAKGNMYPSTQEILQHEFHKDYPFEHKGGLYYVNTCNGYTILDDDTKIESVGNRLLLFDASKKHASSTCTDKKVRININFNYF
jgi:hypothetical protein